MSAFDVAHQPAPVAGQVVYRLAQGRLPSDLRLGFVQPGLELVDQGLAALLADVEAFAMVSVLQVTLDAVELVDQAQCHVGTPSLALGLHLLGFDELASRMTDHEKMSLEVLDNETKSRAFALVILKMLTQQAGLDQSGERRI